MALDAGCCDVNARSVARTFVLAVALALAACRNDEALLALGTLEWDRVELVAEASEPILEQPVREGDRVDAGTLVARLDDARLRDEAAAAEAEAARLAALIAEQRAGAREEEIAEARARVRQAEAQLRNAKQELDRATGIRARGLVAEAELDRARNAHEAQLAELAAVKSRLALLTKGTREETIAQSEAALAAAHARRDAATRNAGRLRLVAPRAGRIESLPFEPGDQPARGAAVAALLVGDRPYARVYVPSSWRARVREGTRFSVEVEGLAAPLAARVRAIGREPSFTPYYALVGDDASRLVYLAELELEGAAAAELPAGLPVRASLVP